MTKPGTDVLVNPAIIRRENERRVVGSYLSFPGYFGLVTRAHKVHARVGLEVERVDIQAAGILAQDLQHETDHMSGAMFLAHLVDALRRVPMRVITLPIDVVSARSH